MSATLADIHHFLSPAAQTALESEAAAGDPLALLVLTAIAPYRPAVKLHVPSVGTVWLIRDKETFKALEAEIGADIWVRFEEIPDLSGLGADELAVFFECKQVFPGSRVAPTAATPGETAV